MYTVEFRSDVTCWLSSVGCVWSIVSCLPCGFLSQLSNILSHVTSSLFCVGDLTLVVSFLMLFVGHLLSDVSRHMSQVRSMLPDVSSHASRCELVWQPIDQLYSERVEVLKGVVMCGGPTCKDLCKHHSA